MGVVLAAKNVQISSEHLAKHFVQVDHVDTPSRCPSARHCCLPSLIVGADRRSLIKAKVLYPRLRSALRCWTTLWSRLEAFEEA